MFLDQASRELAIFIVIAKSNLHLVLYGIGVLWLINFINWYILRSKLNRWGLRPRKISGLIGFVFSPILHGNFNHLLFNSIPLSVLSLFILSFGLKFFITATLGIILIESSLVWLFARDAYHIGASGLISGYFSFVLVNSYLLPSITSIFIAALTLYYFGGIFLGIFPTGKSTMSWESHLFGFIAGIVVALTTFY